MGACLPLSPRWNATTSIGRACRQQLFISQRQLRLQSSAHSKSSSGADSHTLKAPDRSDTLPPKIKSDASSEQVAKQANAGFRSIGRVLSSARLDLLAPIDHLFSRTTAKTTDLPSDEVTQNKYARNKIGKNRNAEGKGSEQIPVESEDGVASIANEAPEKKTLAAERKNNDLPGSKESKKAAAAKNNKSKFSEKSGDSSAKAEARIGTAKGDSEADNHIKASKGKRHEYSEKDSEPAGQQTNVSKKPTMKEKKVHGVLIPVGRTNSDINSSVGPAIYRQKKTAFSQSNRLGAGFFRRRTSFKRDEPFPRKGTVLLEQSTVLPRDLQIEPLELDQPAIPKLSFGLDRALFNSGVYLLQDPHSKVYNFDPYLQRIMPVNEFDYSALKQYKTSSQDTTLQNLAKDHGKRFTGSTSSMTSVLSHFHYLLSAWREINIDMLSRGFHGALPTFTKLNQAPASIFLRWKDGTFAIDADKEYDTPNVLMMLGKSMEKLLTLHKDDFERYRKDNEREVPQEEQDAPEAYQYTTMGPMLMRSQLDAYDPRLPGNGTFDLKTRAVLAIRMDTTNFEPMLGYELSTLRGKFNSYEREYHDMLRSTMLKYMLQARMGRMDGIFLAYHNIERIFGFQYLPMRELDDALHGTSLPDLGDQEFKMSLELLNKVLERATARFPEQSLRLLFKTSAPHETIKPSLYIYAEPFTDDEIDAIQSKSKLNSEKFERKWMGIQDEDENADREQMLPLEVQDSENSDVETSSKREDPSGDSSVPQKDEFTPSSTEIPPPEIGLSVDLMEMLLNNFEQEPEKPEPAKPLFAMCVRAYHAVNDADVKRPYRLKATDKWQVKYRLIDMSETEHVWRNYQRDRLQRSRSLRKFQKEKFNTEETVDSYIRMLRAKAAEGRELRKRLDEQTEGKIPVVWGT